MPAAPPLLLGPSLLPQPTHSQVIDQNNKRACRIRTSCRDTDRTNRAGE
jgi:hypothetical protein